MEQVFEIVCTVRIHAPANPKYLHTPQGGTEVHAGNVEDQRSGVAVSLRLMHHKDHAHQKRFPR